MVSFWCQARRPASLSDTFCAFQEFDLCAAISRVRSKIGRTRHAREDDDWGYKKASSVHIDGRIVLNIWRLMRAELNLTSYTLENLVYHILHQRQ